MQDLLDAGDVRGRLGGFARIVARDQHMDIGAELLRGGHRVERRFLDHLVVVLREDQDGHQITFASLRSLSTRVFASATFAPALRFGGSVTLRTDSLGETSTERASGLGVSRGFFFAFMMFGSVT